MRGLILEGGAMRGMFTCGALDVFMEQGIVFDGMIGVSAGAVFGCNYKSRQPGRALRYNKRYCADKRYCSFDSLLRTGDLYNAEFCYHTLPTELDVFDTAAFQKNPMAFYVTCTDVTTGKAVYHRCDNGDGEDILWMRASASMPLVSRVVEIGEEKLLDGGIADSVPLEYMESLGYRGNVVILTQPLDYMKKPNNLVPLARTLLQCRKSLRYYESAAEKQGFIQRIGALIADFKRAGVTPEQLTEYAKSMDEGAAHDKFADLALIYARYEAQLAGQFVDGEDVLDDVLQKLPGTGLFRDARAAVFGFDVFTGQMNRLLLAMAAESRETLALIVLGEDEGFAPVRESAARLQKEAEDAGIPCKMTLLPPEYPDRHPQLAHLAEQYLHTPGTPWPGPCDRIRLYAAPNPYFEAHFAAQEMVLLHERGVAFGEMAVVLGDEGFAGVLDTVLESYRIPAYVARKLPALRHGAPRLLVSALRAVAGNYDAESMLSLLKSGYAPLTENECWQLENYLLAYGVRGRMWRAPFTRGSAEERAGLEEPRARLITPLENLREALRAAPDAEDSLRAVFEYLRDTGVYETLQREQEQLTARDLPAQAVQARQVWDAMMQLLSQAHALLSGTRVTAGQLANWLEAGLEACELSSLPPAADAVMCCP